jgi:protein arginine kinase
MSLIADCAKRPAAWTPDAFAPLLFGRLRVNANLRGLPYPSRMSKSDLRALIDLLQARESLLSPFPYHVNLYDLSESDWELLAERWLLEAFNPASKDVVLCMEEGESHALLLAGDDHLSFSARGSIASLMTAVDRIENALTHLDRDLGLAKDAQGALQVSSPFLCGSGALLSLVFHLPCMAWWGQLEEALDPLLERGICYRTWQDGFGDFLVLENVDGQGDLKALFGTMMGVSAELAQLEDKARNELLQHRKWELEDRIYRALAICRHAHMMGYPEWIEHYSLLRLGMRLNFSNELDNWNLSAQSLTPLLLSLAPAHMDINHPDLKDGRALAHQRAELLRTATQA